MPDADDLSVWEDVLAAEPAPVRRVGAVALDRALAAVGDFADLRSTWTRGRSTRVAETARAAGRAVRAAGTASHRRWVAPRWWPTSARWACRPGCGSSPDRSGWRQPSGSGCTRTCPSGSLAAARGCGRWPRSPGPTMNGSTGPATTGARPPRSCRARRGCSPPRTCGRRWARTGHTALRTLAGPARDVLWAEVTAGRLDGAAVGGGAGLGRPARPAARSRDRPGCRIGRSRCCG